MEDSKVTMYLTTNQDKFPAEKMMLLREKLEQLDDSKYVMLTSIELKNPTTMILFSVFLGAYGVDRFMLKDTGMGVLKLLTGGCCGILTIIDWFTVSNKTKEFNFNKVMTSL